MEPQIARHAPQLENMLRDADAALIIGDPALRIEPASLPYEWLDLGSEWLLLTNLPMVFAAWAGKPELPILSLAELTRNSYQFGKAHLHEIIAGEHPKRNISEELARCYLTQFIRFEIGQKEQNGLEAFLELTHGDQLALQSRYS